MTILFLNNFIIYIDAKYFAKIKNTIIVNLLSAIFVIIIVYFKNESVKFSFFVGIMLMCFLNCYSSIVFFKLIKNEINEFKFFLNEFYASKGALTLDDQNKKLTNFFKIKKRSVLIPESIKKTIKLNTVVQIIIFFTAFYLCV
jgi:hypothetical protein